MPSRATTVKQANFAAAVGVELIATLSTQVVARFKENFCADNMCNSFETGGQAIKFLRQVTDSLASGGFRLSGFASSSRHVVDTIPPSERAASVKDLDLDQPIVESLFGSA